MGTRRRGYRRDRFLLDVRGLHFHLVLFLVLRFDLILRLGLDLLLDLG